MQVCICVVAWVVCRALVVLLWRTWHLSCSIRAWSDLIMTIQFLDGYDHLI
jgi:hypothetical protein